MQIVGEPVFLGRHTAPPCLRNSFKHTARAVFSSQLTSTRSTSRRKRCRSAELRVKFHRRDPTKWCSLTEDLRDPTNQVRALIRTEPDVLQNLRNTNLQIAIMFRL